MEECDASRWCGEWEETKRRNLRHNSSQEDAAAAGPFNARNPFSLTLLYTHFGTESWTWGACLTQKAREGEDDLKDQFAWVIAKDRLLVDMIRRKKGGEMALACEESVRERKNRVEEDDHRLQPPECFMCVSSLTVWLRVSVTLYSATRGKQMQPSVVFCLMHFSLAKIKMRWKTMCGGTAKSLLRCQFSFFSTPIRKTEAYSVAHSTSRHWDVRMSERQCIRDCVKQLKMMAQEYCIRNESHLACNVSSSSAGEWDKRTWDALKSFADIGSYIQTILTHIFNNIFSRRAVVSEKSIERMPWL